jgi:secretion/DNA translocation related TadE-like protein
VSAPAATLAWCGVAAAGVGALGLLAQAWTGQIRADAAADLAALAASDSRLAASADPCATAAVLAEANGAELLACSVDGEDVLVRTAVPVGAGLVAEGRARAGPDPVAP